MRDVPANLVDVVVLLSLFVIKLVNRIGPNVFLPDNARHDAAVPQYAGQAADVVEGVEMVHPLMETIHAILMAGRARQQRRTTRRAAASRCESIVEYDTLLRQSIYVRCLADFIPIGANFKAAVVGQYNKHISLFLFNRCDSFFAQNT